MLDKKINLRYYFYENFLNTIGGVRFSQNKIDIMACLIHGKDAKSIAHLLHTEAKTIHNNISEINQKLNCGSKQGIITLIECSPHYKILRKYYDLLLLENLFNQLLNEIHVYIKKEQSFYLIIHGTENGNEIFFLKLLNKHLSLLSIKTKIIANKAFHYSKKAENQDVSKILYIISRKALIDHLSKHKETNPRNFQLLQKAEQSSEGTFFIFIRIPSERDENIDIPSLDNVCLRLDENYYPSFLELLEKLFPTKDFEHFKRKFCGQNRLLTSELFGVSRATQASFFFEKYSQLNCFLKLLLEEKKWIVLGSLLFLVTTALLILLFKYNESSSLGKFQPATQSDLVIPLESKLLKRLDLIAKIEKNLKGEGIKAVALVGIGGAGKTTIARYYTRRQTKGIIWEINAETHTNLIASFENLAFILAKTEDEKKAIRNLREIKDTQEREKALFLFIKNHLKEHPEWLLIYDNVETFSDIQNYFPYDPRIWGVGKIILTTRDENIQNNNAINHTIHINELTTEEKEKLFFSIMGLNVNGKQKEQVTAFLTHIPPFPLDISTAAYYLKVTGITYKEYLERLKEQHRDFDPLQENILKTSSSYNKTRYKIIHLSLQHLIKIHQDFESLFLFISLLDSQNIPRDLLDSFKDKVIIDNFIFNLKKFSLILPSRPFHSHVMPTFSIHRSTQEIALSYLTRTLSFQKKTELFQSIVSSLENYVGAAVDKEDFVRLKCLINHCEVFLNHTLIVPNAIDHAIKEKLGAIYFYNGDYSKAISLLEEDLVKLNYYSGKNYNRSAQALVYLGYIFRDLGNYTKAAQFLEQGLLIYRKHFSQNYTEIAKILSFLGLTYRNMGNYEKAKDFLDKSIAIYKKHLPQNYHGLAKALAYAGHIYRSLNKYVQAKELLEQSLSVYAKHLPENHAGLAWAVGHLGNIYREMGEYNKAKYLLDQSLTIYKKHLPENHAGLAWTLIYLGEVHRELGNYKEAESLLNQSLLIYKTHPKNQVRMAWPLGYLGMVFLEQGHYDKAKKLFDESFYISKKYLSSNHEGLAWILKNLAELHNKLGNHYKAKDLIEQSILIYKDHFSQDNWEFSQALVTLASIYKKMKNYRKARKILKECLVVYIKNYGEMHPQTAKVLCMLGQLSVIEGSLEEGKIYLKKALGILKRTHLDTYICFKYLMLAYLKQEFTRT